MKSRLPTGVVFAASRCTFQVKTHPEYAAQEFLVRKSVLKTNDDTMIQSEILADLGLSLEVCFRQTSKIHISLICALYGTWGPLDVCKILLRGVASFCPPGNHHSEKQKFELVSAVRAMPGN
jgi:hypothetical protein